MRNRQPSIKKRKGKRKAYDVRKRRTGRKGTQKVTGHEENKE